MLWKGRINAITGVMALVAFLFAVPALFFNSVGLLTSIAIVIIFGALLMRLGIAIVDMFYRAFLGRPLVYDQRIDGGNGKNAQITE